MKIILSLFVLFSSTSLAFAQPNPISEYIDHYSNVIPETPNASTFTKYGGTTLNLSKGIPNISVPIYNLTLDGVTIPISISYDASGIKTNDLATAVGLKWRLNVGGGVFRSINNMADDNGWLTTNQTFDNDWFYSNHHSSHLTQYILRNQTKDYSPDSFSYNINNYSNSFIFQKRDVNTILKNKNDNFKLTAIRPSRTTLINGFTGQDVNGNTYNFGSTNNSKEFNSNAVIVGSNLSINSNSSNYVSSWLIDQITTKNNYNINFEYVAYGMDYTLLQQSDKVTRYNKITPQQYYGSIGCNESGYKCGTLPNNSDGARTNSHIFRHEKTSMINRPTNKLISKIYTDNIEVNFTYVDDQTPDLIWNKKLTTITILDKISSTIIKEFDFSYDLYEGDQRLMLKEVKEILADEEKPPYVFTYNKDFFIPNKNTFSRDIFGYYNGADNPSSAITFTPSTYANMPLQFKYLLADRRPNIDYLVAGNLEEIQYPTGGKSVFEYELNQEDNGLGMDKYEKGGFNFNLGVNDFANSNSSGDFRVFNDYFTVPENTLIYNTYSNVDNITTNVLYDTSSNANDANGATDCNNFVGIDCSKIQIFDMDNNRVEVFLKIIGYGRVMTLPAGNYEIVVSVRESEIIATPNLSVNINFQWYREFLDDNNVSMKDPHYAGGLRVKKTKDIDTDGKIYNETDYEYSGLIGQSRNVDDYSQLLSNRAVGGDTGEYIMSSDFIGHIKSRKSGYFYSNVTTKKIGSGINGFTQIIKSTNTFERDLANNSYESKPKGVFTYDKYGVILSKTLYNYSTNTTPYYYYILGTLDFCYNTNEGSSICPNTITGYNNHRSVSFNQYESRLVKEVSTQYFFDSSQIKSITNANEFYHNSDELIIQKISDSQLEEIQNLDYWDASNYNIDTNQKVYITDYTYPNDYPTVSSLRNLITNRNLLALPISIKTTQNNAQLSGGFFEYDTSGNIKHLYSYNKGQGSNNSTQNYIPANYDLNSTYSFDAHGNIKEVSKTDGTHIVYIWGYGDTQPIAKIENATYAQVLSHVPNLQTKSNTDTHRSVDTIAENGVKIYANDSEGNLREALDGLRDTLPNALVTTYTYDPLIGVTSMTDPRGSSVYYDYDGFNRLKHVKDQDGNILSKSDYKYRPQN